MPRYFHGRYGQQRLTDYVVLFSESLDTAISYAGRTGSVWELVSWENAKTMDWSNPGERKELAALVVEDYFNDRLPSDIHHDVEFYL